MAQTKATFIIIAPPPAEGGTMNSASASVLSLIGAEYLVTADHVVQKYLTRVADEPTIIFQAGRTVVPAPLSVVWRDADADLAIVALPPKQASEVGVTADSAPNGWPPPVPRVGEYVLVAGYPSQAMVHHSDDRYQFNALATRHKVTSVGSDYCMCQWERDQFISFGGPGIPEAGSMLGGLSGGPVFLEQRLSFPLIGAVSQFQENFELLRVGLLAAAPATLHRVV